MSDPHPPDWESFLARRAKASDHDLGMGANGLEDAQEELDPNDLALLMDPEASSIDRDSVLKTLDSSPTQQQLVAALAEQADVCRTNVSSSGAQGSTRSASLGSTLARSTSSAWWAVPLAAAAALLLAFVLVPGLKNEKNPQPQRFVAEAWNDSTLTRAFDHLNRIDHETFQSITPILQTERLAAETGARRGGMSILSPHGAVLNGTPTLAWSAIEGAKSFLVRVINSEGEELVNENVNGATLPWPTDASPLQEGEHYVLRVATSVGGIRAEAGSAFHRLTSLKVSTYKKALKRIQKQFESNEERALMSAHVAARLKLCVEAHDHLAQVEPSPESPAFESLQAFREYLRHVCRTR